MAQDKKLWTRADVRAEMHRLVKGAADACKAIHAAGEKIQALGRETGFAKDAIDAVAALIKRATPTVKAPGRPSDAIDYTKLDAAVTRARYEKTISIQKTHWKLRDELLCKTCKRVLTVCICRAVAPTIVGQGGDFAFPEKTWGDRGCTCAAKNAPVSMSDNAVLHGTETNCPFRPGGPRENEFRMC